MGNQSQGLNGRLARKKRIKRMKSMLLWFLFTWMLALMVISVMLIAKVNSLQKQIDIITKNTIRSQQAEQKQNHTASPQEVQRYDTGEGTGKKEESRTDADTASVQKTNAVNKAQPAGQESRKKVYLTFDDGPSRNTEKILDILDKYEIKASFFVTGREDEASLERYREIAARGHTLGMHSYSHKYDVIYESLDSFRRDFEQIRNKLRDAAGVDCWLYRFPGGSSNKVSRMPMRTCIRFLEEEGITYFDWNVECGDASSKDFSKAELVENVISDVKKHQTSVVLLHDADNKEKTVKALPVIIEQLQAMDAQILPIDKDTTVIQHVPADSIKD